MLVLKLVFDPRGREEIDLIDNHSTHDAYSSLFDGVSN